MQMMWDLAWDPKCSIFVDSPGIHFDKTSRGYMVRIPPARGGGSGGVQQFSFVSDGGDYIVATPAAGGSNVNLAKPPKLRCSIASETYIDGTGVHTFAYTAVVVSGVTVAYTRTNTLSAGSQVEQITPAYLPGDLVYALAMPTLNLPTAPGAGTTVAVSLLDIHDKDWAT